MQQLSGANRSLRFSLGGCVAGYYPAVASMRRHHFPLYPSVPVDFTKKAKKRALFANLSGTAVAIAVVRQF
jgi:hypothetical protein